MTDGPADSRARTITYEPALLGLARGQAGVLNDDRAGRTLDRLFLADRGGLLTELVTGMIGESGFTCSRLHSAQDPRYRGDLGHTPGR